VFVIATPSSSELPFSFEQKILQYKQDMVFADFSVEYIKSPSETNKNDSKIDGTIRIIPEENKVYIFGKSSFGKDRILTTRHIMLGAKTIDSDNIIIFNNLCLSFVNIS
jgi:type III restriction enzyme